MSSTLRRSMQISLRSSVLIVAGLNLPTALLLGDNSDATTFDFILPALNNPETHKYIGVSFFPFMAWL